jgi:hypothetical protein
MPGKQAAAAEFVARRAKALNEMFDATSEITTRVGGPVGQISLVTRFADMGEFEKKRRAVIKASVAGELPDSEPGVFATVEESIWLVKD